MNLNSPILQLYKTGKSKSCDKLISDEIVTIYDLMWIFPLKIQEIPPICSFSSSLDGEFFQGIGKIISVSSKINTRMLGKRRVPLHGITVYVEDAYSNGSMTLQWFNSYPSTIKKLESLEFIHFKGIVNSFRGRKQIINPEFNELSDIPKLDECLKISSLVVKYPTVNTVNGSWIKKTVDKIPEHLWDNIQDEIPAEILKKRNLMNLKDAFKVLHGKTNWNKERQSKAFERVIYQEFFEEQAKIYLRREQQIGPIVPKTNIKKIDDQRISDLFPFKLTDDQKEAIQDIKNDFLSGHPMMRLIQGDVGCGKTAVAMAGAFYILKAKRQVAFMCPTETLARQQFNSINETYKKFNFKIKLIVGPTKEKDKQDISKKLKNGEINLIVGTHSLIQDKINFKDLGLLIIDEQHKFGVNQRLKIVKSNNHPHCLIMTATPIPRSLRLTQFGDLDITTIKTIPMNRKGIKTKIVTPDNFEQFLIFVNTRLSLKEQVYIVVPAINESVDQSIIHLEKVFSRFKVLFKNYRVEKLHGQMKTDEKTEIFSDFKNHKIDLLVSTSVIEVGINVVNATIMAIMMPERFGLSSLHQLRGRVGRGEKPGFCFLVNDKFPSPQVLKRQQVIEKHIDGFKISEEDLIIRGEGDLFGTEQSGALNRYRIASIIQNSDLLESARIDFTHALERSQETLTKIIDKYSVNPNVTTTI